MDIVPGGHDYNGREQLRHIGTADPLIIGSDDQKQMSTSNSTEETDPVPLNSAAKRKQTVDEGDKGAPNKKRKKSGPPKGTKYKKRGGLKRGLKLDYNQKVAPMVQCKEINEVIQIAKNNPLQLYQMFLTLDEAELRVFYHTSFYDKGPDIRRGRVGQERREFGCERENCGFKIIINLNGDLRQTPGHGKKTPHAINGFAFPFYVVSELIPHSDACKQATKNENADLSSEKRSDNEKEVKKRLWTKYTNRLFSELGRYGITSTKEGAKVIIEGKRKEVEGRDTKDILRNAGRKNKLARDEGFSGENASTAFFGRPMLCMASILKGARKENHVAIVTATGDDGPRYRVRGMEGCDLSDLNPADGTQFSDVENEDREAEENDFGDDTGATTQSGSCEPAPEADLEVEAEVGLEDQPRGEEEDEPVKEQAEQHIPELLFTETRYYAKTVNRDSDDLFRGGYDDVVSTEEDWARLFYRKTYLNPYNIVEASKLFKDCTDDERFKMFYVATEEMVAFKGAVRPLIALDGSFMKRSSLYGKHVVMIAAASTGNSCNVILAFAIAPAETEETWSLFLKLLRQSYKELFDEPLGLISDAQEGLGNAVDKVMPEHVHLLCFKHLLNAIENGSVQLKNSPDCKNPADKRKRLRDKLASLVSAPNVTKEDRDHLADGLRWLRENLEPPGNNVVCPDYDMLTDPEMYYRWLDSERKCSKFNCVASNFSEQVNNALSDVRNMNCFQLIMGIIRQQQQFVQDNLNLFAKVHCIGFGGEDFTPASSTRIRRSYELLSETIDDDNNIEGSEYNVSLGPSGKTATVEIVEDKKQFYRDNDDSLRVINGKLITAKRAMNRTPITRHLSPAFLFRGDSVSRTTGRRLITWNKYDEYQVDLERRTCSCGFFQNDQFPCPHALAVISELSLDPMDFCHHAYSAKVLMGAIDKARMSPTPVDTPLLDLLPLTDTLFPSSAGIDGSQLHISRGTGRPGFDDSRRAKNINNNTRTCDITPPASQSGQSPSSTPDTHVSGEHNPTPPPSQGSPEAFSHINQQ